MPSSGIFLKHYSKHIESVSPGGQISMPNWMSRTTTMMHARFTSSQRCISSGAGLNWVLDQVLWRRRISSLIRLKWCVIIINNFTKIQIWPQYFSFKYLTHLLSLINKHIKFLDVRTDLDWWNGWEGSDPYPWRVLGASVLGSLGSQRSSSHEKW